DQAGTSDFPDRRQPPHAPRRLRKSELDGRMGTCQLRHSLGKSARTLSHHFRDPFSMRSARLSALQAFIVLYGMIYAAFGAVSPFWPLFFESRGLTAEQIGILFGLGTMTRLVAGPVIGRIADVLGT